MNILMRNFCLGMFVSLLACWGTAFSAPIECKGPPGSTRLEACYINKDYIEKDKELNEAYQSLKSKLEGWDDPEIIEQLIKTQRVWIKFRDENCELSQMINGGLSSISFLRCRSELTRVRLMELKNSLNYYDMQ